MRLADYSSDQHCFEFDPHTGDYSRLTLPTPRQDRAGYFGMGQLLRAPREGNVLVAKYLLFSLANLPVDLVPHDASSLDKQRADFIETWSGRGRR